MPKSLSLLVSAVMSLVLSGCFISDEPKFPLDTAVATFGEGGRYEVLEHQKDGSYRHDEVFTVRHLGNGGYEFVNEKGDVLPISFHRLTDNLFVGQAKPDKEKPGYGYVVVRVAGNEALVYAPQCDKQDMSKLKPLNVTLRDKYNCVIDGVSDPLALFAILDLGEPTSKMVRE